MTCSDLTDNRSIDRQTSTFKGAIEKRSNISRHIGQISNIDMIDNDIQYHDRYAVLYLIDEKL